MAWDWRNKDALRRKCPDAGNGLGGRLCETVGGKERFIVNDFLDGEAGCRDKMLLTHKKIWTFFPIRAKYLPAFQHQPLNGRVAQW